MNDLMTCQDYLRDVRTRMGWSQVKLANELKMTVNYISQIERGVRHPGDKFRIRLHNVTNIDFTEIFLNTLDDKSRELLKK